jgi:hypothetical protein
LDPAYEVIRREDLTRPSKPLLLKLTAARFYDGKPFNTKWYREDLALLLRHTGLIRSSYAGEDGTIAVTTNNINDDETKSWRHADGPGASGRDSWELTVALAIGGITVTKKLEHAVLCFSGRAKEPDSLTGPMEFAQALGVMSEQMWLRALREFQREGVIPKGAEPVPPVN